MGLDAMGFDPTMASVYRLLLANRSSGAVEIARRLDLREADVRSALRQLEDLELLRPAAGTDELRPVNPALALRNLLDDQKRELRRRQDAVERCEVGLAEIVDIYSQVHGGIAARPTERLIGIDVVRGRIEELARTAAFECLTFNPGGAQSPEGLAASRPLDQETLGRGVRMRTVYLDSVRNDPATTRYAQWLNELGGEVRTMPSLPIRMIIFDRKIVITPMDPENTRAGGVQLTEPGVVAGLFDLFGRVWASATVLGTGQERDDRGLTRQEQDLLRLLGTGLTDQVVAKRLGLSPRTTRRMMADLMRRLEAGSRFEAGMRAARRQWV